MPTDVTPGPFRYQQQFPIAFEHPRTYIKMFGGDQSGQRQGMNMGLHQYQHQSPYAQHPQYLHSQSHSHPQQILPTQQLQNQHQNQQPHHQQQHPHQNQTYRPSPSYSHPPPFLGPPSLLQPAPPSLSLVHPMLHDATPNKCLPNGVRNPYAPYAGEAYVPSSEKADRMSMDQTGSPLRPIASLRSHAGSMAGSGLGSMPIPIPIPGSVMSNQGWAAPGSISNSAAHQGGRRVDEGWDGSQGRAHMGHMPDPTSTAGRLGRTPEAVNMGLGLGVGGGSLGWRGAPSSWQNHARLTPGLMPGSVVMGGSPVSGPGSGLSGSRASQAGEFLGSRSRSGSGGDPTRPRRASFVLPGEECAGCPHGSPGGGGLKRSGSGKSKGSPSGGSQERRLSVQSQGHSPIVNSPLARIAKLAVDDEGQGVRRRCSGSSHHSPGRSGV